MANESFNPFSIGPPNSGASLNIKIPTCPSYPPPVHAVAPKLKVHTNRSVSQDSMPKLQLNLAEMKGAKSQIGEVAISKAINEEMAVSKQQAITRSHEYQRINAGGGSQMNVPTNLTKDGSDTASLRTLLPVRGCSNSSKQSRSMSSEMRNRFASKSSVRSKASGRSHLSDVTKASKETQAMGLKSHGDSNFNSPSKHDLKSSVSRLTKVSKASKKDLSLAQSQSTLVAESSKRSNLSKTSKEQKSPGKSKSTDSGSTIKSRATVKSSRKSMNISTKQSNYDNISLMRLESLKSKDDLKTIDHLSHHSIKSIKQTDNASHHSIYSKKEPASLISLQQKKNNQVANVSQHSMQSERKLLPSVSKQLKNFVKDNTPSEVIEEANDIANRLKAGNADSFRRFSPLIRTYANTEPEKLCRDDRMSQWFKEAVLS